MLKTIQKQTRPQTVHDKQLIKSNPHPLKNVTLFDLY